MSRRIALVGTAPSGIHAPFDDPSWGIWGVGMRAGYVTRADRWFELHRLEGESPAWANEWRRHVRGWAKDCEIVMFYPEDLGPKITPYPSERIIARFGTYFLTSSFAWMMAWAIDEMCPPKGRKTPGEIGLWGVDMEYGTEYRDQRVGLRHFMDVARVLGIKVTRLASSGIAYEPTPYPMIQDDPLLQKLALRKAAADKQISEWRDSLTATEQAIAQNHALIAELRTMTNGYDPAKRIKDLEEKRPRLVQTQDKIRQEIAHHEGGSEERSWVEDYLRP